MVQEWIHISIVERNKELYTEDRVYLVINSDCSCLSTLSTKSIFPRITEVRTHSWWRGIIILMSWMWFDMVPISWICDCCFTNRTVRITTFVISYKVRMDCYVTALAFVAVLQSIQYLLVLGIIKMYWLHPHFFCRCLWACMHKRNDPQSLCQDY